MNPQGLEKLPHEYVNFRLKSATQRKLRILAANTGESMLDVVDRLTTEAMQKMGLQPPPDKRKAPPTE